MADRLALPIDNPDLVAALERRWNGLNTELASGELDVGADPTALEAEIEWYILREIVHKGAVEVDALYEELPCEARDHRRQLQDVIDRVQRYLSTGQVDEGSGDL